MNKNIFSKIINIIKNLFNKKTLAIPENSSIPESNTVSYNNSRKEDFLENLKINKTEDPKLLDLKQKFENNEINLSSLSNEEINNLHALYKRHVEDLKKKLDNKKTELNTLNFKLNSANN